MKQNTDYQRRRGIYQQAAEDLRPALRQTVIHTTRRIARILDLDGHSRIDYRLSPDGKLYEGTRGRTASA